MTASPERPDYTGAERARLDRVFRGVNAAILALEALTVLLVPRTVAQIGSGLTGPKLTVTLVLAAALLLLAGLQRRRWAFVAGSVLQVALIGTGFLVTAMFFLGVVFAGIWLYTLRLRADLLGRLGQPR